MLSLYSRKTLPFDSSNIRKPYQKRMNIHFLIIATKYTRHINNNQTPKKETFKQHYIKLITIKNNQENDLKIISHLRIQSRRA
mgnify:CR=1 FL=1